MAIPSARLPAFSSPPCYLLSRWTLVCHKANVSSHPHRSVTGELFSSFPTELIEIIEYVINSISICGHSFCPTTCIQLPTLLPPVTLNLSLPKCWRLLSSTQECNRRALFIISHRTKRSIEFDIFYKSMWPFLLPDYLHSASHPVTSCHAEP